MCFLDAIYGGTFDPVHYGHLKPIEILANLILLKRIIIIPNKVPPHRPKPEASIVQRKEMLKLAINDNSLFHLDERELYRNSPSYTFHTLQEWRKEIGPNKPLAFIIGQDSFINFSSWYHYQSILENSHLIVCRRPGYPLFMKKEKLSKWLENRLTCNAQDLYSKPFGNIYLAETPWFNISASIIRDRIHKGKSCTELMPPLVLNYVLWHGLYKYREQS